MKKIFLILLITIVALCYVVQADNEVRTISVCANVTPINNDTFRFSYSSQDGNQHSFDMSRNFSETKNDCSIMYTTVACNQSANEQSCIKNLDGLTNMFYNFSQRFDTNLNYVAMYTNCSTIISNQTGCSDKLHYEADYIGCKDQIAVLNKQIGNCSSLNEQVNKTKSEKFTYGFVGLVVGILAMKVYEGRKWAKTPVQRIPQR